MKTSLLLPVASGILLFAGIALAEQGVCMYWAGICDPYDCLQVYGQGCAACVDSGGYSAGSCTGTPAVYHGACCFAC